jgi:hypothetical protein
MKWIKRHLRNWLLNEEQDLESRLSRGIGTVTSREHDHEDEGLNIHVRSAIGGRIVRFRHYDSRADRNYHKVYIVPEDQDFERELGRMITLESMR